MAPRQCAEIVLFLRESDRGIGIGGVTCAAADAGNTDIERRGQEQTVERAAGGLFDFGALV